MGIKEILKVLTEKKENNSSKKNAIIILICSIVIIVLVFVLNIIISNNRIDDTYRIASKISAELKLDYDNITFVEEKEDTNDKYSYLSSTLIYIDSIGSKENEEFAVAVSKYNSNAEALKKKSFLIPTIN